MCVVQRVLAPQIHQTYNVSTASGAGQSLLLVRHALTVALSR